MTPGKTGPLEIGFGQVQEAEPDLQRPSLAGLDPAGDIAQTQVEVQAEIIVTRQRDSERMVKVTVWLRRIPGDLEILVGRIPGEQIRIAEHLPSASLGIGREVLNNSRCAGHAHNGQAGQGQHGQTDFKHRLIFQMLRDSCGAG